MGAYKELAEALKAQCHPKGTSVYVGKNLIKAVIRTLEEAEHVVRCKDCVHWKADDPRHPWCEMWEDYQYHGEVFCFYGKRKDGE